MADAVETGGRVVSNATGSDLNGRFCDPTFLRRLSRVDPLLAGFSNKVAPVDAQANYEFLEASEERFLTRDVVGHDVGGTGWGVSKG